MGKKDSGNKNSSLGRSLVKSRFGKKQQFSNSVRHTTELQDGQDWGRLNLQSITEQTNIDDFLSTAELAGTEFQAEKLNIHFVPRSTLVGVLSENEKKKVKEAQDFNKKLLRIPRRPPWNQTTTAEELAQDERASFLSWRKDLVDLQAVDDIIMTPFEKNLEFWRQLWRVIERSDVVAQILDARNPLLFRCEDLEKYVKEINKNKENLLIINKSDFLTEAQRCSWAEYFNRNNINFVFFSALETEILNKIKEKDEDLEEESGTLMVDMDEESSSEGENTDALIEEVRSDLEHLTSLKKDIKSPREEQATSDSDATNSSYSQPSNLSSPRLLSRIELIEIFKTMHTSQRVLTDSVTIGLVGYPNVGKSSTINSIMREKKVSVSATPGKTKHFQTLKLTDDVILCDCPGLVFPGFVSTKAEMVVSGILPIDQMRDHVGPVNIIASLIPPQVFEGIYGIILPKPQEGEDPNRPPTSEELLNSYGFMRGFMTQRGLPDNPRSARYVLKDYMNGKLLYCHCPPDATQENYHGYTNNYKPFVLKSTPQLLAAVPEMKRADVIDEAFFSARSHKKGIQKIGGYSRSTQSDDDPATVPHKPWKKHHNSNKREKGRRKYSHLDE